MTRNGPRPGTKSSKATAGAQSEGAIDTQLVRDIADMLRETEAAEIEVEKGDLRIRVARYQSRTYVTQPDVTQSEKPEAHRSPPSALAEVTGAMPKAQAEALPILPVSAPADHPGVVKSPMVGTAFRRPSPDAKAFVEIGTAIKSGDKILLVEAMKTFNEIVAPREGVVTAIFVEDGQPVEYGQPLLVIE